MVEKHKDITIGSREFRLGRVPANIGSWIVTQLGLNRLSDFDTYQRIKNYMFDHISLLQDVGGTKVPMRIYADGRWQAPELDLDYDLELFEALFNASLGFNFDDFFKKRKAEQEAAEAAKREAEAAVRRTMVSSQ